MVPLCCVSPGNQAQVLPTELLHQSWWAGSFKWQVFNNVISGDKKPERMNLLVEPNRNTTKEPEMWVIFFGIVFCMYVYVCLWCNLMCVGMCICTGEYAYVSACMCQPGQIGSPSSEVVHSMFWEKVPGLTD